MKKILSLLLAAVLVCSMLTACGEKEGAVEPAAENTEAAEAVEEKELEKNHICTGLDSKYKSYRLIRSTGERFL